jgi:ATP-binding cassette subfamily C (CFTR/MRP) protein 1
MLGSMKSVKMMGLSNVLFDTIHGQRVHELEASKKYRVLAL